jgi:tetratricopeptide (TPR) repeat protein
VLLPALHPDRSSSLNNLANAVRTRFGNVEDLEEAIQLHREALELRPAPYPDRSSSLDSLAGVIPARFKQRGNLEDLDEAIQAFEEASVYSSNSPFTLFPLATHSAKAIQSNHASAMCAYQVAIGLFPGLAAINVDLLSRQRILTRSHGIGSDAIACAVALGQHEPASEFLEASRSVLRTQPLHLYTSFHDVRVVHLPSLASVLEDRFMQSDRLSTILGVAEGLRYLHSKGVVHGDLKTVSPPLLLSPRPIQMI